MRRKRKTGCAAVILVFLLMIAVLLCAAFVLLKIKTVQTEERAVSDRPVRQQEVPVESGEEETIAPGKYYYDRLSVKEQLAYQNILYGVRENREEIQLDGIDAKRANELFQFVLKDSPDIFWCEGNVTSKSFGKSDPRTTLKPEYDYDPEERSRMQEEIEREAGICLSGIPADASDYEKILYVYEYIVNHVTYDTEAEDNQNIYSALVNKRSVCAGYSRTMQYLLERLGVFCMYVTGDAQGQAHAWNIVACGGDYYHVDVTWGDPVFQTQEEEQDFEYISYDYMCCSDTEIRQTHTPDEDVVLPPCTKMDQNYYVVNGMYYTSYDSAAALETMKQVIRAKSNPVVLKYPDQATYEQAKKDIFENVIHDAAQELAQQYHLLKVKYSYIDDEKLHKIVIYWDYS